MAHQEIEGGMVIIEPRGQNRFQAEGVVGKNEVGMPLNGLSYATGRGVQCNSQSADIPSGGSCLDPTLVPVLSQIGVRDGFNHRDNTFGLHYDLMKMWNWRCPFPGAEKQVCRVLEESQLFPLVAFLKGPSARQNKKGVAA
jgi:hypothetical protein